MSQKEKIIQSKRVLKAKGRRPVPYSRWGEPNEVMAEEEKQILSEIEKARNISHNASLLGLNAEVNIIKFLRRYSPPTLRFETGHFITPKGYRSPQIDILVLDPRFPLLGENKDGSILAMGHAVIGCISVKRTIGKREIKEICATSHQLNILNHELLKSGSEDIYLVSLGLNAGLSLKATSQHFFEFSNSICREFYLRILRAKEVEQDTGRSLGAFLWWEGLKQLCVHRMVSPLSDFFYDQLQISYHILARRNYDFKKIGEILMEYFHWGTARGDRVQG